MICALLIGLCVWEVEHFAGLSPDLIGKKEKKSQQKAATWKRILLSSHNGRKSLILAPQEIPDISGYQWGFGCQFVKAYNNENPVKNEKIL